MLPKTTSFRLFLFIIFSFQNFMYHSGITNGYQCSYWYYDSYEVNLQVVNSKYSSPQPTNILYIIQLPFILLLFCLFSLFNFQRKYPGLSLTSPNNLTVSFIPPIAATDAAIKLNILFPLIILFVSNEPVAIVVSIPRDLIIERVSRFI